MTRNQRGQLYLTGLSDYCVSWHQLAVPDSAGCQPFCIVSGSGRAASTGQTLLGQCKGIQTIVVILTLQPAHCFLQRL